MQIVELRLAMIVVAEIANVNSNERARNGHTENLSNIRIRFIDPFHLYYFDFHTFPIRYKGYVFTISYRQ